MAARIKVFPLFQGEVTPEKAEQLAELADALEAVEIHPLTLSKVRSTFGHGPRAEVELNAENFSSTRLVQEVRITMYAAVTPGEIVLKNFDLTIRAGALFSGGILRWPDEETGSQTRVRQILERICRQLVQQFNRELSFIVVAAPAPV